MPDPTMDLPTFHYLLREAFEAMEAVDRFDLHSEDDASLQRWKQLLADQAATREALVGFVLTNTKVRRWR